MGRRPRHEEPGAFHHVWVRGVDRRDIFGDDADRRLYLELLEGQVRKRRWRCLAFCLMTNHLHFIVYTPEPNLGVGMHRIHLVYVRNFNARIDRVGRLFQERYGSSRLWTLEAVAAKVDYVEQNPVAAGLCRSPRDWPWGSACGLGREWVARPTTGAPAG